jgi:hypothetical protein
MAVLFRNWHLRFSSGRHLLADCADCFLCSVCPLGHTFWHLRSGSARNYSLARRDRIAYVTMAPCSLNAGITGDTRAHISGDFSDDPSREQVDISSSRKALCRSSSQGRTRRKACCLGRRLGRWCHDRFQSFRPMGRKGRRCVAERSTISGVEARTPRWRSLAGTAVFWQSFLSYRRIGMRHILGGVAAAVFGRSEFDLPPTDIRF